MAGTRSAPTVNGTPQVKKVNVRFVDHTGDLRSVQVISASTVTDAEIEAMVADMQAISRASIFEVNVTECYYSQWQASNAEEDVWENVSTNLVALFKDDSANSQNGYIPAPIDDIFVDGTDNPDGTNTDLTDWLVSTITVLDGGAGGSGTFSAIQGRLTHRTDRNQATPL